MIFDPHFSAIDTCRMKKHTVMRNPLLQGFISLDGRSTYGVGDWYEGDPVSRQAGKPTSLTAIYGKSTRALPRSVGSMQAYGDWLPYLRFPSLNEGGTPMVDLDGLAAELGIARLGMKREASNPTGSHKDRMSPLALARAMEIGAKGVVCASSGNAAISLAAYAAAASVPCRIVVTPHISDGYRRLLSRMGAELVVCASSHGRWETVRTLVDQGWYPITNFSIPAVGSNPYGVQGYKTVAFEIWQQYGHVDAVVVPCSRGDLIWGIGEGFREMREMGILAAVPRLHAAEPFPRISRILAGTSQTTDHFPGETIQFSIAGDTATDQAVRAVRDSAGSAVFVDDAAAQAAQAQSARHGIDLEISSASALGAVPILRSRAQIDAESVVVIIGTANSAREPAAALAPLRISTLFSN